MFLQSLKGCRLVIGSYPEFNYDARGGGGEGKILKTEKNKILHLIFSNETFSIPPLTSQTTKFLSLPLPPGLMIKMSMDKLEGTIDKDSGEVLFEFESRFIFSIGGFFTFPDLLVKTSLGTGKVKGEIHEEEGVVLNDNGRATLVGISLIPVTSNKLLNAFLNLPNEALAVLECEIKE